MGICYGPSGEEEVDKAFFRQLEEASCSQVLVFTGDLKQPDICWKNNTAELKQLRKFLEYTDDNFLAWVTEEPVMKIVMLDLILTNKEGLTTNVEVKDNFGCSGMKWWNSGS